MSLELIELAAARLGPVLDEVAFLGGASLALWTDDPGAPDPRVTMDVDVIVVLDSRVEYYRLAERLRSRGLSEDHLSGVLCRWRDGDGLILDVMPTDEAILGFSNRWYPEALETAEKVTLPSGTVVRAVTPPLLFATKLEAFNQRGGGDYLASVDFEDIVRLVDGRQRLVEEVAAGSALVREFIAGEAARMLVDSGFEGAVAAALLPDAASQARRSIVLERVQLMAGLAD